MRHRGATQGSHAVRGEHRVFAALYDRLTAGAERAGLAAMRARLLSRLRGHVVELGPGTGANLQHYRGLTRLSLVEPDAAMARRLRARLDAVAPSFAVDMIDTGAGGRLPLKNGSVDAVVSTLVLCSVDDVDALLGEVRRVLRPDGELVVIEHVVSPRRRVIRAVQHALTPLQRLAAGGCRLDRDTLGSLDSAGFDVRGVERVALPGVCSALGPGIAGVATLGERAA